MTFERVNPNGQYGPPLLLRPVWPRHYRNRRKPPTSATEVETQAWELIDPWASPEESPAATATTRRLGQVVCLVDLAVGLRAPEVTIPRLMEQLVALLRRSDASVIFCSIQDPDVCEELVGAGFVPVPKFAIQGSRPSLQLPSLMLQLW